MSQRFNWKFRFILQIDSENLAHFLIDKCCINEKKLLGFDNVFGKISDADYCNIERAILYDYGYYDTISSVLKSVDSKLCFSGEKKNCNIALAEFQFTTDLNKARITFEISSTEELPLYAVNNEFCSNFGNSIKGFEYLY